LDNLILDCGGLGRPQVEVPLVEVLVKSRAEFVRHFEIGFILVVRPVDGSGFLD